MRSIGVAAVSVALILALSGCAAPEPEPRLTPTGFATEEEAFAAAEETYREYVEASNQVDFADPDTAESVYRWVASDALAASREEFTAAAAEGWTRSGAAEVLSVEPYVVTAPYEEITIDVCVDVSDVEVTGPDGDPVAPREGIGIQSVRVGLAPSNSTSTHLAVTALSPREDGPSCVG